MKLFRIFKKKPRLLGHGQAVDGPIPTASDVSTAVDSDVPASDVPDIPAASSTPDTSSAGGVPAANSTPDTSSHPIGAEILVHGVGPITAE